ncbi:hypothetical protein TNCV_1854421 [Trichonephila clavipes]|nr:hypothetical protein TNCV_1854421 [Trichonephila clavipes]
MEVTYVEQCSYIKIAVFRGGNAMEYHNELADALGNNALPYRTVARGCLQCTVEYELKPQAPNFQSPIILIGHDREHAPVSGV